MWNENYIILNDCGMKALYSALNYEGFCECIFVCLCEFVCVCDMGVYVSVYVSCIAHCVYMCLSVFWQIVWESNKKSASHTYCIQFRKSWFMQIGVKSVTFLDQ